MAGQPGQPKYGSGWPDGLLAGLGQPGHREARPLFRVFFKTQSDQIIKIYTRTHQIAQNFLRELAYAPEPPSIYVQL